MRSGRRGALRDVAGGAGLEHPEHLFVAVLHAERDDRRSAAEPLDLADHVETGGALHAEVDEGHVGRELPGEPDGLAGLARLADHLEVGLALDDQANALTDDAVVVGQEAPDLLHAVPVAPAALLVNAEPTRVPCDRSGWLPG